MTLAVIILTFNEERHIARAIESVAGCASRVIVVDSGSTDRTVEIAQSAGADVWSHVWTSHAAQFNWALDQLGTGADWVMRLDADEIVSERLSKELSEKLPHLRPEVVAATVRRRMNFLGQPVRRGGVFPVRIARLLRPGHGRYEARWMDEHLAVEGAIADLAGEIVDDNLQSLTWWTEKHNRYAGLEVVDLLNREYQFAPGAVARARPGSGRWFKDHLYLKLPAGFRAWAYFQYRWTLRLGRFDTEEARLFHKLQGYWYRTLVDAKLYEVKSHMKRSESDPETAIREVLGIDVSAKAPEVIREVAE